MRSLTITAENLDHQLWDEDILKFCDFYDLQVDGQDIECDFIKCSFVRLDWYLGMFFGVTFVGCRFNTCTFAGCDFREARFVECTFQDCSFIKDNLGGSCKFEGSIAYGCSLLEVALALRQASTT